ncbi:MAG TPA: porin family protein [Candidatus Krumholzibacterium sp.]|nr:porin family protein [Candidatus Krumholzibacterium sp.]
MRFLKVMVLAVVSVLLLSNTPVQALGLNFGVKAGLMMSNVDEVPDGWDSPALDKAFRTGFVGGVFVNMPLAGGFSIQPELLYAMKGARFEGDGGEVTAKFDYLMVPVLAKFELPLGGILKPCIFAGPSISFNIGSDVEIGEEGGPSYTVDFSDAINNVDYGFVLGAGFGVGLGAGTLTFDLRYEMGLAKVIEGGEIKIDDYIEEVGEEDATQYNIAFMAGFSF